MATNQTPSPDCLLRLIQQADEHYKQLPPGGKPARGRPLLFDTKSFFLLSVCAVVLRCFKGAELERLILRDASLRHALGFARTPHRKTIARRLARLLPDAERQVKELGREILAALTNDETAVVSAIDGRMYAAAGALWHKQDREADRIPSGLRNVDRESRWFKSGYRGWVQGYRLVMQGLVFPQPVPLFATWTMNNVGEATTVKTALAENRLPVTSVLLGDETFGGQPLTTAYTRAGGFLLTPKQLSEKRRSWKDDLFSYRKETIELLFQRVLQAADLKACPSKGLCCNGAFVLVSVWLYQLIFWCNYRQGTAAADVKEQIELARWRIHL
ncbi:MAG: hypothetical protein H0T60_15800 [Acidobacteria bacterium]|nr:hypothetical protein [Acidobacteriota bacterium]